MDVNLTERTVRLVRDLEKIALELIDTHGTSRSALGPVLGVSGNTLVNNLKSSRAEGDTTDPRWAFAVMEHFGFDPASVLPGLCSSDAPEVLLSILPVPSDPAEEKRRRRTKAYKTRVKTLRAARELHAALPSAPEALSRPWPERRHRDPDLEPVYRELEELEERRRQDVDSVEEVCGSALLDEPREELSTAEALRRVGLLGIWGIVQRSRGRLEHARDALAVAIASARKLADESLLARQLIRAAYVFQDLEVPAMGVALTREASERFRADRNRNGDAYALVDRASMAGNQGQMLLAERLFLVALEQMSCSASSVYKIMAAQGVAICLDQKGDIKGALSFLAAAASKTCEDHRFRASLLHTAANIQRKLARFQEAESKYWEALGLLGRKRDAKASLRLYLDLAVCLIQSGNRRRLGRVLAATQEMLPNLRNQSFVQEQCELLIRELSSEQIDIAAITRLQIGMKTNGL